MIILMLLLSEHQEKLWVVPATGTRLSLEALGRRLGVPWAETGFLLEDHFKPASSTLAFPSWGPSVTGSKALNGSGFPCWVYGVQNSERHIRLNLEHLMVRLTFSSAGVSGVPKNCLAPCQPEAPSLCRGEVLCQNVKEMWARTMWKVITRRKDRKMLCGLISWGHEGSDRAGGRSRGSNKAGKIRVMWKKQPRKA